MLKQFIVIVVLAAVAVAGYALLVQQVEVPQTSAPVPPTTAAPAAKPQATPKPAFALNLVSMGNRSWLRAALLRRDD